MAGALSYGLGKALCSHSHSSSCCSYSSSHGEVMTKGGETMTAREMLNKIDAFLEGADDAEANNLWSVLTALRGPDFDYCGAGWDMKHYTTEVIRSTAFPRTARRELFKDDGSARIRAYFAPPSRKYREPQMTALGYHFISHARVAARALGLL